MPPTKALKSLLAKALNKNQILLLKEIANNSKHSITSLISKISKEKGNANSTLRYNAHILSNFGLIKSGITDKKGVACKITSAGEVILSILGNK